MNGFVCFNGELVTAATPIFFAGNRGFNYGDGVFETARLHNGQLLLQQLHFERLLTSLQLLNIEADADFTQKITSEVALLSSKNNCTSAAKIRLAIFRGAENKAQCLIEATPLPALNYEWNERGWTIAIHPGVQKSCDGFANLKSANYLPYVLAGLYAKEVGADECLVLNSQGFISDGSRTNVFAIKDGKLYTPALHQGCVNGVMRRFVIEKGIEKGYSVMQTSLSIQQLLSADEVFLTNAIKGIVWVASFNQKQYSNKFSRTLFDAFLKV